jgi:hypothetical protein
MRFNSNGNRVDEDDFGPSIGESKAEATPVSSADMDFDHPSNGNTRGQKTQNWWNARSNVTDRNWRRLGVEYSSKNSFAQHLLENNGHEGGDSAPAPKASNRGDYNDDWIQELD